MKEDISFIAKNSFHYKAVIININLISLVAGLQWPLDEVKLIFQQFSFVPLILPLPLAKTTHLKSTRTAIKKVWKLQFLLMCVSSSTATFPNIYKRKKKSH